MIRALLLKFLKEALFAIVPVLVAALLAFNASIAGTPSDNPIAQWVIGLVAVGVAGLIRALQRLLAWDPEKAGK